MTKTENYQLNQWDAADPIRREDFNADNAAIDAALLAVRQTAESKADADAVAALAQSMAVKHFAVGSYTGTDGTQTISLEFTPRAVFVRTQRVDGTGYSGLAFTGSNAIEQYNNTALLEITTNGFSVTRGTNASLNHSTLNYHYLALG